MNNKKSFTYDDKRELVFIPVVIHSVVFFGIYALIFFFILLN